MRSSFGGYNGRASKDLDGEDDADDFYGDGEDEEDYDDMGMGVSSTVPKRARPRRLDDPAAEPQNPIFEIADAAQEIADSVLPPDEFDKYKRKPGEVGDGLESGEDDGGLGMTVSSTVAPAGRSRKGVDTGDRSVSRGIETLLGGSEAQELDRLGNKDVRRAQMEQRGLSDEQISAYLGDDLSVSPEKEQARWEDDQMAMFQDAAYEDIRALSDAESSLRNVPSSTLVDVDEKGDPYLDRFVYVDEYTCIGCTHCSHTAPSTFFMEPEHGRARVFQQGKDAEAAVRDAILTCPVDCIHYVDWNELRKLESEREGVDINFKARLVGNTHDSVRNGQQVISGDQGMRCNNCPSKGCYNCPMYSVGFNPEYLKRKEESKAKRQARRRKEEEELMGPRSADL